MKSLFAVLLLVVLSFCPSAWAQNGPDDKFVNAYSLIQRADQLQAKGRTADALTKLNEAQKTLRQVRDDFPEWNPKLVKYRIDLLSNQISNMTARTPSGPVMIDGPAGPLELKLILEPGKRYLQHEEASDTMETSLAGLPISQKIEMRRGVDAAISVTKVREDGAKEMEMEFVALSIELRIPGKDLVRFDTAQPLEKDTSRMFGANLRKVIGGRVKYLLGTNGVSDIEGIEELQARLGTTDDAEIPPSVKAIVSEATVKQVTPSSSGLPTQAVKIGDSWPVQTKPGENESLPSGTVTRLTGTFKGWQMRNDHKCVVIEYSGDMTPKAPEDPSKPSPVNATGKISGKSWFDPALGYEIETQAEVNAVVKITGTVPGQNATSIIRESMGGKLLQVAEAGK